MTKEQALETINQGVVDLCTRCDIECPVQRKGKMGEKLPHCYLGTPGRNKFYRLQEAIGANNANLSEAEEEVVGGVFKEIMR